MQAQDLEWVHRKSRQFTNAYIASLPHCRMSSSQAGQFLAFTNNLAQHPYLFNSINSTLGKYLFTVDAPVNRRHLMGCNAALNGASSAMQEYRRTEFYVLGLWARQSLLQWRRGINVEHNLRSWVTFERVCGSARGFSYNEKLWISHGQYPAYFQHFCVSFCDVFGTMDPISWYQGTNYNADHFQYYAGSNIVATAAHQSLNIDTDMKALIHGNVEDYFNRRDQAFLNHQGKLILFQRADWIPSLLLDSLMRVNGALQQAVGARNGLSTWRSMLMAMHAAMDFMAVISLITINAVCRNAHGNPVAKSREELFGDSLIYVAEAAQLVTIACTGFSPNHHRLFSALCIWALYGSGKSAAVTMLENDEALPFRMMVPECMFGLVGSDLYEITIGKAVWWDKLHHGIQQHMLRAYYQKTSREKLWEWTPAIHLVGSEFCGPARIYVWASPSHVNHYTIDTMNGRYMTDCNYMILGIDLLGAIDLRSDGTLHRVLEGQIYNGCVVGTTQFGYQTVLTQTQQLYTDSVGSYRNSNYLRPQQVQLLPFSIDYNQHRTIVIVNNSILHSGFVNELPGLEGLRKINPMQCNNNPRQMLQLMEYIIDCGTMLTWSSRLSFGLHKMICRSRCQHNAWIDMNPWLLRRYFNNTDNGWVENLTFLWSLEWADNALLERFELYLRRCNRMYYQRYRSGEQLLDNLLKEDVVQIFAQPLSLNQREATGINALNSSFIVEESPSTGPRRRLLQRP
jgi:hypothetical protein